LLLVASGVITTAALALFTVAARRMDYSALGFVQYLSPTIVFPPRPFRLPRAVATDPAGQLHHHLAAIALFVLGPAGAAQSLQPSRPGLNRSIFLHEPDRLSKSHDQAGNT
jgi:hypothetical protein